MALSPIFHTSEFYTNLYSKNKSWHFFIGVKCNVFTSSVVMLKIAI